MSRSRVVHLGAVTRVRALISASELDQIKVASKDSLAHHGINYSRTLRAYTDASSAAWESAIAEGRAVDMSEIFEKLEEFELAAVMYSPGLIGELARAVKIQAVMISQSKMRLQAGLDAADSAGAVAWRESIEKALERLNREEST
ncbi:MAG: hypothetical protein AAGI03_14990 [Pseudomonadota bacterium]